MGMLASFSTSCHFQNGLSFLVLTIKKTDKLSDIGLDIGLKSTQKTFALCKVSFLKLQKKKGYFLRVSTDFSETIL